MEVKIMKKKKILSILVIGLIVLGMVAFVLTNYLHADCSGDFANCSSWCATHTTSPQELDYCNGICLSRFAKCLDR